MDFLDIRKKAKERARARAAEGTPEAVAPDAASAAGPPARDRTGGKKGRRRPRVAATPDGGAAELGPDAVAERLRQLPPAADPEPADRRAPEASEPPSDDRFTTWRPGHGAPPFVLPPPVLGPLAPPHEDDFKLISLSALPPAAPLPASAAVRSPMDPLDEFFYRPGEEAPELPRFGTAVEVPPEEPGSVVREEYLLFLLGSEEYAVAIDRVREVIRAPPITEVPRAPTHVLGVVTVRGEVIGVVDPRLRLGLPPGGPGEAEGKVVIVDAGDGACGLLVDRVAHVVRLARGSIEQCPQGIAGHGSDCLAGIGREGDRIFTVLDVGALLRRVTARAPEGAAPARRTDAIA